MFRHRVVAFLLMSNMTCMWKPLAAMKFFEKTRYPIGTLTCALDEPSLVIPLDQLSPSLSDGDSRVAPGALCTSQCLKDPDCTNYNYREYPRTCEIFHYTPTNCSPKTGCYHAEVSDLQGCQIPRPIVQLWNQAYKIRPWPSITAPPRYTKFRAVESTKAAVAIVPPPTITSGNLCDKKLSWPNYVVQVNQGFGLDQNWQAYKYGFSDANGGYWIGNENLYRMTNNGHRWNMCIDVQDQFGVKFFVSYSTFIIDAESVGYTYFSSGMQGSPTDPMGPDSRKYKFTTKDKNNQPCCCANQAASCKGGWWWSCGGGGMFVLNGAGKCGFSYSVSSMLSIQGKRSYIRISQQ